MIKLWVLVFGLLISTLGYGAVIGLSETEYGTLTSAQATTGGSTNQVAADGALSLAIQYKINSGTATIQVEESLDNGTTWSVVSGSASSTNGVAVSVMFPLGLYRTNITSCSSCSVTTKYGISRQR